MKLSEYLSQNGMTLQDYIAAQKRKNEGVYSYTDYRRDQMNTFREKYNSLVEEASSLHNEYKSRFFNDKGEFVGGFGKEDSDSAWQDYQNRYNNVKNELNYMTEFLDKWGNQFDSDSHSKLKSYISDTSDTLDKIGSAYQFYSDFHTEYDYNAHIMNNTEGTERDDVATRLKAYESNSARIKELDEQMKNFKFDNEGSWGWTTNADSNIPVPTYQVKAKNQAEYDALQEEKDKLEKKNKQYEDKWKTTDEAATKFFDSEDWEEKSSKRDFDYVTAEDLKPYVEYGNQTEYSNDFTIEDPNYQGPVNSGKYGGVYDPLGTYLNASEDDVLWALDTRGKSDNQGVMDYVKAVGDGDLGSWHRLTEDEKGLYYYMLNSGLRDEALAYLDGMTTELNRRETVAMQEDIGKLEGLDLVFANAASVAANVVGQPLAFLDDALHLVQGKDINPYSGGHTLLNYRDAVRGTTAEKIDEATNNANLWGISVGDAYQGLMSGVDSAVSTVAFGKASPILMGMGAASSTAKDLWEQGASKWQIVAGGLLSGAAEMLFEKVSVGYFFDKFLDSPTKGFKNWALKTLTQSGIEASEEGLTEIANILSNALVMGSQSEWEQMIAEYKKEGLSDSEAIGKAFGQMGLKVWEASAGGFISGGGMGAVGGMVNAAKYNQYVAEEGGKVVSADNVQKLVAQAKNLPETKLGKNAKKLASPFEGIDVEKLNDKQKAKLSKNVGKLYEAVLEAQTDALKSNKSDVTKQYITDKLKANGITNETDIAKGSDAIYKVVSTGKALTSAESKAIEKVDGLKVVNDILNDSRDVSINIQEQFRAKAMTMAETEALTESATKTRDINTDDLVLSEDGKTRTIDTEEEVSITGVSSIKGDKVIVSLSNGKTSDLKNISFGNEKDAILYTSLSGMGIDAGSVNQLIKTFKGDDAKTFALGIQEAIRYGEIGAKSFLNTGTFSSKLNEGQRDVAYRLGVRKATRDANARKKQMNKKESLKNKSSLGYATFEGVDRNNLNARQKVTVNALEAAFGSMGVNVVFFQSPTDAEGRHIGANGSYNAKTNTIRLDISAGIKGQDAILFTAAHELTHFIKEWSGDKFKVFSDFLVENYAKRGVSIDDLINHKIEQSKNSDTYKKPLTYTEAFEEVVCDSCETFLRDSKLMDKLIDLAKQDLTLFEKCQTYIDGLLDSLRKSYAGLTPDSREANEVLKMTDAIEELHKKWEEAALSARANKLTGKAQKNTTTEGDVKLQAKEIDANGNEYWQIESNKDIFKGINSIKGLKKAAYNYILRGDKGNKIVGLIDGESLDFVRVSAQEYVYGRQSQQLSEKEYKQKMRMSTSIIDLIENASINYNAPDHKSHKLFPNGFKNYQGRVGIDETIFRYIVRVGKAKNGMIFYDINLEVDGKVPRANRTSLIKSSTSNTKIPQSAKNVKGNTVKNSDRINQSMTMEQAKTMVQKSFVSAGIKDWYDDKYKNGDEWLKGEGVDEVAMYIENEYTLQEKYLNKIQAYLDGDIALEEILQAYLDGTLVGQEKPKANRLDTSVNYRINDSRFYSPKRIENVKELFEIAGQKLTSKNKAEVSSARAKILLFAHNEGASELLGLTKAELNQKLRSWSGYTSGAREISQRINKGVADSNKWTGIENCSWLVKGQVTAEELESLVKEIIGSSSQYERNYIARTMLALDTHIDWTELTFDFKRGYADENRKSVRGLYDNRKRTVTVGGSSGMNTVAHEMGHALDYKWHRDLFGKDSNQPLSENAYRIDLIQDEEGKQFYKNFRIFIDSLTDVNVNYSSYTMEAKETFARFVARFVEWVETTAGGRNFSEGNYYADKFTGAQYIEFVKLLQEKAMLDAKRMSTESSEDNIGIKFDDRESLAQACDTLSTISDEDYLKSKEKNPFVLVMNYTPQIVLDSMNGDIDESKTLAKDRKVIIRRDALYLAIRSNGIQEGHYHELGKDVLKNLPMYLEQPDVILKTKDNDRRLVLSHIESKNGQAIISVEFESIKDFEGSKDFFNVIITVFDLHENYLKKLFKKNGAEIKYEKEDLEQSNPQLYKWLRIINSKSSANIVAQEGVKSQGRDYLETGSKAVMTTERINYLIEDSGAGSRKDYANYWITSINPTDFLNMTLTEDKQDRSVFDQYPSEWNENSTMDTYDYLGELKKNMRQTPYLAIDINTGKVDGHEGRHRMRALERKGIKSVEIRVEFRDEGRIVKYSPDGERLQIKDALNITNQYGTNQSATIKNIIPLNNDYRNEILANYGENVAQKDDISYQDRDKTAQEIYSEIEQHIRENNKSLSEDAISLKQLIQLQKQLERKTTNGKILNERHIEQVARSLMRYANAKGDVSELVSLLKESYNFMLNGEDVAWESIKDNSQGAVDWLMRNKVVTTERTAEAQEILDHLRTLRVKFSETQKGEAATYMGSWNDYRKSLMGSIVIAEDGMELDMAWQELANMFPGEFDADEVDGNQPRALYEAIDSLKNSYVEDDGYYEDEFYAQDLFERVYDGYWNVSTIHTIADAKKNELNALKSKHNTRMEKLKENNRKAIADLKKKQALKIAETRQSAYDRAHEKIDKSIARDNLHKLVVQTARWLTAPKKTEEKCPDLLRAPYSKLLNSFDISSRKLQKTGVHTHDDLVLINALNNLANAVDKVKAAQTVAETKDGEYSENSSDLGYLDLPADFVQDMRDLAEKINKLEGKYDVAKMSAEDIHIATRIIRTLNHSIREMSKIHTTNLFENIRELSEDTIIYLSRLGKLDKTNAFFGLTAWDVAEPIFVFKRFGKSGEAIFEALMDAQDKLAYHSKTMFEYRETNWDTKDADKWSKDTHTIELTNGKTITGTTADFMSFYCTTKRAQGVPHLLGGGIRIPGLKKGGTQAADSSTTLNQQDVLIINGSLSEEQIKVADAIQKFFNTTTAKWGNEIYEKRFLTKLCTEQNYFPLESDSENLALKDPTAKQSDLYRLLNISATKPLSPNANNKVVIRNIFDVFTSHSSDMATLNAYGMVLLDYMKWVNYNKKISSGDGSHTTRGVRKAMREAFGGKAENYVFNLIKDVNGRSTDGGDHPIIKNLVRSAKTAAVGNSLRVATLQLTALPRASMVLSPKSLTLGMGKTFKIKEAIELSRKYCGIALWKSFGFYDTNIARSIEEQIKGSTDIRQKLIELSLKGAEWGDTITIATLWNACEVEISNSTELQEGTKEFYEAVGKKLREVIYKTQVVDSTLTRSQIMRSKSVATQTATAFMSEPIKSYNNLLDACYQWHLDKRAGLKDAWKKNKGNIFRTFAVYSFSQTLAALVEALNDAWRDEDDEEYIDKFGDAFIENFIKDIVPFEKVPFIADISEMLLSLFGIGYFSTERLDTQYLSRFSSAIQTWIEIIGGDNSNKTMYNAIYSTIRAFDSVSGFSASGIMREVVTLWNNIVSLYDTNLKIRKYESTTTKKTSAKFEYERGNTSRPKELANDMVKEKMKEGKTDKEAKSSVRSSFTATYKTQYVEAFKSGKYDEANRIRQYLYSTGLYGSLSELDATLKNWRTNKD